MILSFGTIVAERYEIVEKIGAGGMAIVYRAIDKKLDRSVTFKVMREEFIADEEFIGRFNIEAQAAAKLSHQNIVSVYDVGIDGDIYYIVMEYIDGVTLKDLINKRAPFENDETLGVAIQIANALEHAHEHGIIHRDIKPQNILVTTTGVVKVTDFGIARAVSASTVTTTSQTLGSVHYFSPEQARGGFIEFKSDIYSLGIVMYEMATGHLPYDGETSVAVALKHINDQLPDMKKLNPKISDSIENIIFKATEKLSARRYQTIEETLNDLKRALTNTSGAFVTRSGVEESPTVKLSKDELDQIKEEVHNDDFNGMPNYEDSDNSENDGFTDDYDEFDDFDEEEDYENQQETNILAKKNVVAGKYVNNNVDTDDYYEDENVFDKGTEKKVIVAAVATGIAIVAVILAVLFFLYQNGVITNIINKTQPVKAPNIVGLKLTDAETALKEYEIAVVETGRENSDTIESGYIISQDIEENTIIKQGSSISVVVSDGAVLENVPEFTNKDLTVAYDILKNTSFRFVEKYEYSDSVPLNVIISQSPEKGTELKANSEIEVIISKGQEEKTITVPDVIGKTESEGNKLMEEVGLVVGHSTSQASETVEEGNIITQTIEGGQQVASGSIINFVVSSGAQAESPVTTETASATKSTTLKIDPRVVPGVTVIGVRVISVASDGTPREIYNKNVNVEDLPMDLPISGKGEVIYRVYTIDDINNPDDTSFQAQQTVNFDNVE